MSPRYFRQLDGLRALATTSVLLSHFLPELFSVVVPLGNYGVQLFLCLSGFLITKILLDSRGTGTLGQLLGRFYGRRAIRLLPPLYMAIAIGAVFLPVVRESWKWHLSYLGNFYFIQRGELYGPTAHLWNLGVEEQFYLVWPILVLGVARWKLIPTAVVLLFVAPACRLLFALSGSAISVKVFPVSNADSLAAGALLAAVLVTAPVPSDLCRRVRDWCIPLGIVAAAIVTLGLPVDSLTRSALAGTALSVLSVGLVAGGVAGFSGPFGRLLESRPTAGLRRISYGVYLYHFLILSAWDLYMPRWLPHHSGWQPEVLARTPLLSLSAVVYLAIMVSLTLVAASLSWRYVEQPVLSLKRYLPYGSDFLKGHGHGADSRARHPSILR